MKAGKYRNRQAAGIGRLHSSYCPYSPLSGCRETLCMRMIKYRIRRPGFRTESVTVLTTLSDHISFPAQEFAELYVRRWGGINLKYLKNTLGMDILNCLSPEMIRKELVMHLIVYNLIRDLMFQAAAAHSVPPRSISFKYSMTIINQ
ncbi:MAG: hypothetical protein WCI51_14060 [Lentisphaerota bacterium]